MDYWYTGINRNTYEATAGKQRRAAIAVESNLIDRKALYRLNGRGYR